jgi:hypothetical protein
VGQRAFALHRCDLGVQQFVVHGDFAHLGFQPGDLIITVVAFAFFQGGSRACKRAIAPIGSQSKSLLDFVAPHPHHAEQSGDNFWTHCHCSLFAAVGCVRVRRVRNVAFSIFTDAG